jgi:flagellar basal body-associated protein FliL
MAENYDAAESASGGASERSEGGNRFLMIGILAGVIILNTLIAFGLIKLTKPKSEEQKIARIKADSLKQATERATSMGSTTPESPIEAIVNIAGTEGDRFLKAAIIFEYDDNEYPDLGEELERRIPKFKDLLINHLSRLTLVEVTEPDAKDKIRKDLLRLVNATLPPKLGEVREVLFTSYIIQ